MKMLEMGFRREILPPVGYLCQTLETLPNAVPILAFAIFQKVKIKSKLQFDTWRFLHALSYMGLYRFGIC